MISCYLGKLYHCSENCRLKYLRYLIATALCFWVVFFAVVNIFIPSRPLANITYVVWGLANGTLHCAMLSAFDYFYPEEYRFIVFGEMISENRLQIFLLANILSTCIRKIFDFRSSSIIYTLKIVFSYLTISCAIISFQFYKKHFSSLSSSNNGTLKL